MLSFGILFDGSIITLKDSFESIDTNQYNTYKQNIVQGEHNIIVFKSNIYHTDIYCCSSVDIYLSGISIKSFQIQSKQVVICTITVIQDIQI